MRMSATSTAGATAASLCRCGTGSGLLRLCDKGSLQALCMCIHWPPLACCRRLPSNHPDLCSCLPVPLSHHTQLMGTPAARELEYAEKKIGQNFSNYSAWHSRTALLPALYGGGGGGDAAEALAAALASGAQLGDPSSSSSGEPASSSGAAAEQAPTGSSPAGEEQAGALPPAARGSAAAATSAVPKDALDAEYELVKQAFYTEPEDQSGWFYHRWLLGERCCC